MKEKFEIGDNVKFNVFGTDLTGTGEILGKALGGLCPMWIVLINERGTTYMKKIKEKALLIQEAALEKLTKSQKSVDPEGGK